MIEKKGWGPVLRKGEELSEIKVDTEPYGVKSLVRTDNVGCYLISKAMLILPTFYS